MIVDKFGFCLFFLFFFMQRSIENQLITIESNFAFK